MGLFCSSVPQGTCPSWRSTSPCSWSTPRAYSKSCSNEAFLVLTESPAYVAPDPVSVFCSDLQGSTGRKLCVTIEPALLLKGDIMVCRVVHQMQRNIITAFFLGEAKYVGMSVSPSFTVGKVLSQTTSGHWEGHSVPTPVPYLHHPWSTALVWERRTWWSLLRCITLKQWSQPSWKFEFPVC